MAQAEVRRDTLVRSGRANLSASTLIPVLLGRRRWAVDIVGGSKSANPPGSGFPRGASPGCELFLCWSQVGAVASVARRSGADTDTEWHARWNGMRDARAHTRAQVACTMECHGHSDGVHAVTKATAARAPGGRRRGRRRRERAAARARCPVAPRAMSAPLRRSAPREARAQSPWRFKTCLLACFIENRTHPFSFIHSQQKRGCHCTRSWPGVDGVALEPSRLRFDRS